MARKADLQRPSIEVLVRCDEIVRSAGNRPGNVEIPLADLKVLLQPWRIVFAKPGGSPGSPGHFLMYEKLVGIVLMHKGQSGLETLKRGTVPRGVAAVAAIHFGCTTKTVQRLVTSLHAGIATIELEIAALRAADSGTLKRIFEIRALETQLARLVQLRDAPRPCFVEPLEAK